MVKPWLDPVVAAKIYVCKGPEEYVPILIDFIGKENLPANYGGDLPPLSVDVHPYAYTLAVDYGGKGEEVLTVPPTPMSAAETGDSSSREEASDDLDAQMHQLEDLVAHTDFHGEDNTNHTASGKLVSPEASEKVSGVESM